ncbi:hypothetical protein ANCCAN_09643 [Ancylostoma caninum]|uniref:Uncharacterized protein n=1 Tax=Ancylostoma caninum TaxID=29170 RepID=A0A368GJ05_ANCCA|nr:hypothetical protein ANCCAN_09643 [Ancylostoma caninum]
MMDQQELKIRNCLAKVKMNSMSWKILSAVIYQWMKRYVLPNLVTVLIEMMKEVHWRNVVVRA